jgi:hypothetical protein
VLKWIDWMVGESHIAALQYAQMQRTGMLYRSHHLYVVKHDQNNGLDPVRRTGCLC